MAEGGATRGVLREIVNLVQKSDLSWKHPIKQRERNLLRRPLNPEMGTEMPGEPSPVLLKVTIMGGRLTIEATSGWWDKMVRLSKDNQYRLEKGSGTHVVYSKIP